MSELHRWRQRERYADRVSFLRFSKQRRLADFLVNELTDPIKQDAGAHVVDLASGRTVFGFRHDEPRMMASTTKLFTAGTALTHLGADATLTTHLRSADRPDADGVLHGDLFVIGDGDPLLGDRTFIDARYGGVGTPAARLVEAVTTAGIRSIRGRVIGDGSLYAHEDRPSPTVTALSFNQSKADQPVRGADLAGTGGGRDRHRRPCRRARRRRRRSLRGGRHRLALHPRPADHLRTRERQRHRSVHGKAISSRRRRTAWFLAAWHPAHRAARCRPRSRYQRAHRFRTR